MLFGLHNLPICSMAQFAVCFACVQSMFSLFWLLREPYRSKRAKAYDEEPEAKITFRTQIAMSYPIWKSPASSRPVVSPNPFVNSKFCINGNTIDLDPHSNPDALKYRSQNWKSTNYIYIQSTKPLDREAKLDLRDLGVTIQRYLGNRTHLCHFEPPDLSPIRKLSFIRHANCYHQDFKTSRSLKEYPDNGEPIELLLKLHEGARPAEVVANDISAIIGGSAATAENLNQVRVVAQRWLWPRLAQVDDVKTISRKVQMTTFADRARVILGIDKSTHLGLPVFGAYSIYTGAGQIVTVADTGFDLGDLGNKHPAFQHCRWIELKAVTRRFLDGDPSTLDDPTGHGTAVAGLAVGHGVSPAVGTPVEISGTAPGAALIVQAIGDQNGKMNPGTGQSLVDRLFGPAFEAGSRIHNNSWGPQWETVCGQLNYSDDNDDAEAADGFVFDHPDFTIVVAAGNDNGTYDSDGKASRAQIAGIGAAKNVITVGATQSARPSAGATYDPSLWGCMDEYAPAYFSSMGPTREGRPKPDIVAPGSVVLCARSRHPRHTSRGNLLGNSNNDPWEFQNGTSCSAPLVAGCVAVIRQALLVEDDHRLVQSPSAALIKALLVHYATDLRGERFVSYPDRKPQRVVYDRTPNDAYGYGMVNVGRILRAITRSTEPYPTCGHMDIQRNLAPFTDYIFPPIRLPSNQLSTPLSLKVTFVYLDPPGDCIQNHLRLSISDSHGHRGVRWVQDGGYTWSNVQQIVYTPRRAGSFEIIVTAEKGEIDGEQKFAVVWSWQ